MARRRAAADRFPWRSGNRFVLLNDGAQFFPRMLQAIGNARDFVLLEMYLVKSGSVADQFIEALRSAASRGVHVAVLLDGFGSLKLKSQDHERLSAGGVELRFYNKPGWRKRLRNFLRNHRKLLSVDGRVAFVGGAGLTDEFAGHAQAGQGWRDVMVEIQGPVVADWQELFVAAWRRSGGRNFPQKQNSCGDVAGAASGRVASSEGWHRAELAHSVVARIDAARKRVWITSPYFVPSRRFRKALRRAARRGIDVRLLGSGPSTDHPLVRHAARRFFGKLLYSGVRIFEFQPRVLHAKIVLCDDWVSIGSSNLDWWSFKWNLEANQEIDDAQFASHLAAVFEQDCRDSIELDVRVWPRRAWLDRLRERAAGALGRALERCRRPKSLP